VTRRVAGVALVVLFLAAPAAAQTPPPDERAAAQALADAVVRLADAWDALPGYDVDAVVDRRRCRRELRRLPEAREQGAIVILRAESVRHDADAMDPALTRFRSEIAQVVTQDPALISGRAAWRRQAKAYQALPPAGDFCADLADWRRRGYDRATVRAAREQFRTILAASGRGWGRKVADAADRMRELGVPEADAKRFEDP
jgi:hypothetical protein